MRNRITIVATALIGLAAFTTSAQAATGSAKCRKAAKHGKVIKKGPKSLVFELTHAPKILEDFFYGCHYKTGKPYRLPYQDGGDTLHPRHYVFKGDLLAYGFVAWIGRYERRNKASYNVQVAGDGFKARVLDTGDGIAPKSLRFSNAHSTLSWTKDGAARSAPFPPAVAAR